MAAKKIITVNGYWTSFQSPIGWLLILFDDEGLNEIQWSDPSQKILTPGLESFHYHPLALKAKNQLREYFQGKRQHFDLPVNLKKGTPYQKNVWRALLSVPFGKTISYKDEAKIIGNIKHVRSVALANSYNPLPIIIPCHRVIGCDGSLRGYRGGVDKKKFLIDLEKNQG